MTFLETHVQSDENYFDEQPIADKAVQGKAKFTALIGSVSSSINQCELTYRQREKIDYRRACDQLEEYRQLFSKLNVDLIGLDAVEHQPDCCFVQDTAVVLDEICVIASMGAPSRAHETRAVEKLLAALRPIARIKAPGTLDGGDVVQLGRRLFVGCSTRTNAAGIAQLKELVEPFGYSVETVLVHGGLHLTTGFGIVNEETIIVNPRWLDAGSIKGLRQLHVAEDEPWAANTIRIESTVCVERYAPRTINQIQPFAGAIATVDISEFRKAEGSLSCLSLIFTNN